MGIASWLVNLVTRLVAAASAAPTDERKQRAAAEAHRALLAGAGMRDYDAHPGGTATVWHPPVGAFFARRGKARWKHLRRVRG